MEILPAWPLLSAFLIASFVLAITPGPGVLYIVTRSLVQGRRFGLASVAGVAVGNLGNALGAAFGLAALFRVSATAFVVVKYAGAASLINLGIRALRASSTPVQAARASASLQRTFRDGFFVALLNPKTALFFGAFLPQFMTVESAPAQGVALGSLFVLIAVVTDIAYVLAAGALASAVGGARTWRASGRYLSASAFIGLGVFTAFSDTRTAR